jgi:hypothetical protein
MTEKDINQRVFEHLKMFNSKFPNLSIDNISCDDDVSQDMISSVYNSTNPDIPSFTFMTHHDVYNDVIQTKVK